MVQMSERVVLPRIGDVIADVLTLLEEVSDEGESWSQMVLDFLDAFKQMRVCEKEQKHLGGQGLGGFFLYQVVLFGIRSALGQACSVADAIDKCNVVHTVSAATVFRR